MRVEKLEQEYDVEVEWKGLEIHPEFPAGGVPREVVFRGEYYRRSQENVQHLAAQDGLVMQSPTILANTRLALEAAEFARQRGAFGPLHRRLFEAYFQEGLNLSEPAVLARLAGEVGLDEAELSQALSERRYQEALDEISREGAEQGITGIPTFVVGDQWIVGAQPYEALRRAVERAGAKRRECGTP